MKYNQGVNIIADCIVNSLGFNTQEIFDQMRAGKLGMQEVKGLTQSEPTAMLSQIDRVQWNSIWDQTNTLPSREQFTFFEQLMIYVIQKVVKTAQIDPTQKNVLFLFSTTKGNIELLDSNLQQNFDAGRVHIWKSAEIVTQYFQNNNQPITLSNACISGTQALLIGKSILENQPYEHLVVVGADLITPFVVAGFQSFKALSPTPCRPFDLNRDGLNIGEGAAAVVLSKTKKGIVSIENGAITNDANHISGPSRTGEGLYRALTKTLKSVDPEEISFINAHGTATPYNDEMESIAFQRANLLHVPVNSYKGYFGHTLGAAGLIESILSAHALNQGIIFPTIGFQELGVSKPLDIVTTERNCNKSFALKTASGFAGCNVVLLIKKGGKDA